MFLTLSQLPVGQFGNSCYAFTAENLSINEDSNLKPFALSLPANVVLGDNSVILSLGNGAGNSKELFVSIGDDIIVRVGLRSSSRSVGSTARLTYYGVNVEVSLSSANPGEAQKLKPPRC